MSANEQISDVRAADPAWAWAAYRPDAARPWDLARAGHLLRRAGFGADWNVLQQALADGPDLAIEKLVRPEADVAAFNRACDAYEASTDSDESLRAWWLRRMMLSPQPLLEKMTLFWHGHFAVNAAKVGNTRLMRQHVDLLRRHALGDFRPLLQDVSRDPAMLLGLDADANRKARPNDHLARGLFEAFTLGPGQCSAQDVADAARSLTGWFVVHDQFRFVEHEHDPGAKRILGQEGAWNGEDAIRIVLEQPATARRIVQKLYRWLISETDVPSDELLAPLTTAFAKDYDISKLVETMLRSNRFFSPAAYRQRVKSPVEFAIGIARGLEELVPTAPLGADLAGLGQNLYHPPTIRGWPGGRAWINTATLLGRANLAAAMLAGAGRYGEKTNPLAVARKHGHAKPEAIARFFVDLFLQGDLEPGATESLVQSAAESNLSAESDLAAWVRQTVRSVATLPEFQLA
jgi:uncharacterized protein (DUF1800 family)